MRDVLAIRLSDAERQQVTKAATRLGKTVSAFLRESALQSSAVVENKVVAKAQPPGRSPPGNPGDQPRDERELVVVDLEPEPHYVDGELVSR